MRPQLQAANRGAELIPQAARDGALIVDLQGRILQINDALCQILGYTREELLGTRVADMEAPQSSGQTETHLRRVLEHGFDDFATRYRIKDGSLIDVQVSTSVLRSGADTRHFAFVRDITGRSHAEEALRASEERYRLLVENLPTAIFLHESGGIFRYVNPAAVELFGLATPEALLGRRYLEFVHPEERAAAAERVRQFTEGKPASGYVVRRIVRPSGEVRLISTIGMGFREGERRLVQGMAQDITELIRHEELLRESDAKFSAAFQGSIDPMCIIRTRDGLILEVNHAYEQLVGYSREELVGHTVAELGLTADPSLRAPMVDKLLTEGKVRDLPWRSRTRTGEIRELLHSAFLIGCAAEPLHVAIIRDVTEQQRHNRELRESEAKFSATFHASVDAIVISRLSDGLIIDVNEAYICLTGYPREALIGRTTLELGIVADPAGRVWRAQQAQEYGSLRDVPSPVRTRSGEVRDCLQTSFVVEVGGERCWVSVMRDVTEARRAERMLRASEERYRSVVSAMAEGVVLQDASGVIVTCNERARQLLDLTEEELLGRTSLDPRWRIIRDDGSAFPGEQHPAMVTLRSGRPCPRIVMGVYRGDGSLVWLLVNSEPLFNPGKTAPDGVVTTFSDITDQRRMDAELRNLNEQLEARVAERTVQLQAANKELEAFSYSVSHDLRAPLRHIVGYIDLLKRTHMANLADEGKQRLDIIADAAKRMGNLIDSLLAFSRIGRQALQLGPVDLDALLQDVLHELQPELERRDVIWDICALPQVTADRTLLKLVLTNLISNAVKFTRGRAPARIAIGCDKANGSRVFFVKDNGAGFDMRYADKLFGVFERLHSAEEFDGTGIGLANCRSIIERHGGRIWAQGTPDGGATFRFSLP